MKMSTIMSTTLVILLLFVISSNCSAKEIFRDRQRDIGKTIEGQSSHGGDDAIARGVVGAPEGGNHGDTSEEPLNQSERETQDISKQNDAKKDDQQSASNVMLTAELIGFRISKPLYPSRGLGRSISSPSAGSRGFGSGGGQGRSFSSPSAGFRGFGGRGSGISSRSRPSAGSRSWPRGSSRGYYGWGMGSIYHRGAAASPTTPTDKLLTLSLMTLACFVF